ncbi:MAG: hypothetical protein ACXQT5_03625, partial [Candidatus Syntropharchaeia archaeon]
ISIQSSREVMVVQSNLCMHTKYENMDKIYLYPIWEFFGLHLFMVYGIVLDHAEMLVWAFLGICSASIADAGVRNGRGNKGNADE